MPVAAGLAYEVAGPQGAPWLVLSSGLGGLGSYWRPNLPALAARFRVLTYDQRGAGASAQDLPAGLTMAHMAHDLLALLDALGIGGAAFIGHALGAHIGLAAALAAPGRLERIVAVNAWPRLDPLTARVFDVRLELLRRSGPDAFFLAQPLFLYPGDWISAHDADLRAEAAVQAASFVGAEPIERRVAALRAFDPRPRLGEVDVAVLAFAARDDLLVPWTASRALADGLPRGAFAALPCAHACNVVDPDGFARLALPWLEAGVQA